MTVEKSDFLGEAGRHGDGAAPAARRPDPISARELRSAFDNAPIGMAVMTPRGVITAVNGALGRLLGRPPQHLVGGTFFAVTHPEDLDAASANCASMQAGGPRIVRHECRFRHADGSVVWVLISAARVPDEPDHPAHVIMHVEDITDRKALEAELVHRALHDPLTGLANRAVLVDRIGVALTATAGPARSHCLLYVDLDEFKQVNDRYGHAVGDEVLKQAADRMTALLRPGDVAARLGGDEFAILCPDVDQRHGAAIAERLRAAAAEPFEVDGHTVRLSATVGVSTCGADRLDPADLMRRADLDMYEVKRRNQAPRRRAATAW